jgi:8-oxo-dGTP pyrophosphatase MutT (NUDIX family)
MPTFANHWAGISGSIEDDDVGPLEAAIRELQEETNVCDILRNLDPSGDAQYPQSCMKAGMYLDVRKNTKGAFEGRTIRVYPFSLRLPYHCPNNQAADDHSLLWPRIEMRGTEHDEMKFMSINDFLDLAPCVPGLQTAFHHATAGFFLEVRIQDSLFSNHKLRLMFATRN